MHEQQPAAPAPATLRPTLFQTATLHAVQLQQADLPLLQRFFEQNPDYFLAVNGQAPSSHEALDEFNDRPAPALSFSAVYLLGFFDASGALAGTATVLSDLCATGVWHIGLLIVATARHGDGTAHQLYSGLEQWIRDQGAQWLRLGVVAGNARAERFWTRLGYAEVRQRGPTMMGRRSHMLRVMVKPLTPAPLSIYLALVPRDQPGSGA